MLILSLSQAKNYIKRHSNSAIAQEQDLIIINNRLIVITVGYYSGYDYKVLARIRRFNHV